jgi:pimeloyl-ACP methyl ester carboxylesterase
MLRKVLRMMLLVALLPPLAICLLLFGCQASIIYHPRAASGEDLLRQARGRGELVTYATDQGSQTALWLPPLAGGEPQTVWLMCGGNGALASDYLSLAERFPDPAAGFLFVDYPGYGPNPGSPNPARIAAATTAAVEALCARWPWDAAARRQHLAVFGHSLGAAAAVQYAAAHPVRRVVLVAPFTSMLDMARRVVGRPLNQILTHRFDNRARLGEVALQTPQPLVVIIHGEQDEVIPVAMGRELATAHPNLVTWIPVPGADHNGIISTHEDLIHHAMTDVP